MFELNCTTDRYDDIYAPWLARESNLLKLSGYRPGDAFLDLCGGSGGVAKEAIKMASYGEVDLLDLNPRCDNKFVRCHKGRAEDAYQIFNPGQFDVVICRQGLGYLQLEPTCYAMAQIIKPGGKFVFNTFKKPTRFGVKNYQFDGCVYDEVHLYLFGRIIHLQHKQDNASDVTMFRYHSPEEILDAVSPWFNVELVTSKSSLRWVCTRKPK